MIQVSNSVTTSYNKALNSCKCGCLRNKDDLLEYFITNSIWEINQSNLLATRKHYTHVEKDKILRQALYSKLKESKFDGRSSHVKLSFPLSFDIDDKGNKQQFTLCESCFVIFNDHIGKFNYFSEYCVTIIKLKHG